ncbi:predicted protein [Naegleria gruberi]|uniref:Predicted protein n=1 Tax=Naegleria gruberi TaxID=5762 RepID=D2V3E6_NAEGR|nr:uncharacterized protein NAEGRDRAFT_63330 [Naegleria gruberi]EFC48757.1 predicted protein [Naegleria gruberi]|eukprot:XP_002681501.1 predicted protein [Naegleria gruberi strain NEG-M]
MYKVVLGIVSTGMIVIGDSLFLKEMATRKITNKLPDLKESVIELFGGSNIFVENDYEFWHRQRKLLDPAFAPQSLKIVAKVTIDCMNRFLIPNIEKNLLMRNIEVDFSNLTLEVIGLAGFNYDFNSFNINQKDSLTVQTQKLFGILPVYNIFPKWIRQHVGIFPHKPAQLISNQFTKSINDIINERKTKNQEEETPHSDILSLLLNARENWSKDESMTDEEIISNCFIFLVAGHETTARTLGFILYSLATDKDAQDRIHKFIDHDYPTLYGKETFDFEDYQEGRMDYLRAVVKESLRLYPVVAFAARQVTKTFKWKDITIPKGTQIAASWLDIHKDERYWPQPNEFIPERFLKRKDSTIAQSITIEEFKSQTIPLSIFNPHIEIHQNPFAFSGFGIGNRICQGRYFAEIESCFCLALLVKHYKFSISPNYKLHLDNHVTLRPREPLLISFEKK